MRAWRSKAVALGPITLHLEATAPTKSALAWLPCSTRAKPATAFCE